jgi:hypothetical protein
LANCCATKNATSSKDFWPNATTQQQRNIWHLAQQNAMIAVANFLSPEINQSEIILIK